MFGHTRSVFASSENQTAESANRQPKYQPTFTFDTSCEGPFQARMATIIDEGMPRTGAGCGTKVCHVHNDIYHESNLQRVLPRWIPPPATIHLAMPIVTPS